MRPNQIKFLTAYNITVHSTTEYVFLLANVRNVRNINIGFRAALAIIAIPLVGRSWVLRSLSIVAGIRLCSVVVAGVTHELKHELAHWPSVPIPCNERILFGDLKKRNDCQIAVVWWQARRTYAKTFATSEISWLLSGRSKSSLDDPTARWMLFCQQKSACASQ